MILLPLRITIFHSRISWWGCGFIYLVTRREFLLYMFLSVPFNLCKTFVFTPSSSNDFCRPPSHLMNNCLLLLFWTLILWLATLVLTSAMMVNLFTFLFLPLLSWLLSGLYSHIFCLLIDGKTNLLQYLWKADHCDVEQSKFFQLHFLICHCMSEILLNFNHTAEIKHMYVNNSCQQQ